MDELLNLHCIKIKADTPRLLPDEIKLLLNQISAWKYFELKGEPRLEKSYKFDDFNQALAFTNQLARIADMEDHHPAILTEWGKVTVTWWTHRIKGLHKNDFIMAAKTDQLQK